MKPTDQDVDEIYDLTDRLMYKGRWNVLDKILEYITEYAWRYDVLLLVTWATATLAGKEKLEKRKEFLNTCRQLHTNEEIWKGLD